MTPKPQNPLDAALDLLGARTGRSRDAEAQRLGVDRERCDPRSIQNVIAELRGMKRWALSRRQILPPGFAEIYHELAALHNQNVATPGILVPRGVLKEGWAFKPDGSGLEPARGWEWDRSKGGVRRVGAP